MIESTQIDEATDTTKDVHLITHARFVYECEVNEASFFRIHIRGANNVEDISDVIHSHMKENF